MIEGEEKDLNKNISRAADRSEKSLAHVRSDARLKLASLASDQIG
jgi:hypothetical protein